MFKRTAPSIERVIAITISKLFNLDVIGFMSLMSDRLSLWQTRESSIYVL
ncbi:MAG: hypothetical protein V7K64_08820 [Nostoc sp.]|nr:hypothetical protein [Nostoc sp. JL34]MBN3886263.1 hypothetical protein [Nostoc sp. JL34]